MTALQDVEKRTTKEQPVPDRSPMGTPSPASYLLITPAFTSLTLVFPKNFRTASVYFSFDKSSLTVVLLGLALAYLT